MALLSVTMLALAVPARAQKLVIPSGKLESLVLFDSVYQRERRVWVYTPAGYAAQGHAAYDLIVAFDGDDYRDTMPLPRVLDSLAAGGHAPPFVAILIDNGSGAARIGDLANQPKFTEFLGAQLMPLMRKRYNITRDPHRTIVTGSSAGGLASVYVALARPDLFGNVLAQSPAAWRGAEGSNAPYEWLTSRIATLGRQDVRLLIDVGARETTRVLGGTGPMFIEAVQRMRDALRARGYEVLYSEVPNGVHAPQSWRARLGGDIVTLTRGWEKR